jgi:hypothetical protein
MYHAITQSDNAVPIHLRSSAAGCVGQPAGSFPDYFQIPHHGIRGLAVSQEAGQIKSLGIPEYFFYRIGNIGTQQMYGSFRH